MTPNEQFRDFLLAPPVWQEGGSWQFILGTDDVGRDILSRLMFGARLSLLVGCIVVVLSLILGIILGLAAVTSVVLWISALCVLSTSCWHYQVYYWR